METMETAQRPQIVSASRRFRRPILATSHVPGLGQMRTILNALNFTQPAGASSPETRRPNVDHPCLVNRNKKAPAGAAAGAREGVGCSVADMVKVTGGQFGGHVPLCRRQCHPVNKSGSRRR